MVHINVHYVTLCQGFLLHDLDRSIQVYKIQDSRQYHVPATIHGPLKVGGSPSMKRHHFYEYMCALVNGSPTEQYPAGLLMLCISYISTVSAISTPPSGGNPHPCGKAHDSTCIYMQSTHTSISRSLDASIFSLFIQRAGRKTHYSYTI